VYPTKSVYYALFVEEDRALESWPRFGIAEIPKE
jgi:hypothetical protein